MSSNLATQKIFMGQRPPKQTPYSRVVIKTRVQPPAMFYYDSSDSRSSQCWPTLGQCRRIRVLARVLSRATSEQSYQRRPMKPPRQAPNRWSGECRCLAWGGAKQGLNLDYTLCQLHVALVFLFNHFLKDCPSTLYRVKISIRCNVSFSHC